MPAPPVPGVPRVVALGGGHGLAATLQALRLVTPDITAVVTALLASAGNPLTVRAARRLAQQLFTTDSSAFETAVQRVRERRAAGKGAPGPGR